MSDKKINEDNGLSRLLSLAGLKPTLIVMPTSAVEPTDEEVTDEEAEAEMQHSDARAIDPDALTPSKKAHRKLRFVPARSGDNPIDEDVVDSKATELQNEYTKFKAE
jgi:hypothetical protein